MRSDLMSTLLDVQDQILCVKGEVRRAKESRFYPVTGQTCQYLPGSFYGSTHLFLERQFHAVFQWSVKLLDIKTK